MKKICFILMFSVVYIGSAQSDIKQEYFKNGKLKKEVFLKNGKEIKQKFYYKNGQIRYQKNIVKKDIIEEMYSKDGDLTMRLINGKVEFSLYNNQLEEKKEHNHDHGHHHHDGGHHHHH